MGAVAARTSGSIVSNSTVNSNSVDGVIAGTGPIVSGSALRFNGNYGLHLQSGATYRENTISTTLPSGLTVNSMGVNMGGNSCHGPTTCP